jgi:hypothetical protein
VVGATAIATTGFELHARTLASAGDPLAAGGGLAKGFLRSRRQVGHRQNLGRGGCALEFGGTGPSGGLAHQFARITQQFRLGPVESHDVLETRADQDLMDLGMRDEDAQSTAAFQHPTIQCHEGVDRVRVQVVDRPEVEYDASRTSFHQTQGLLTETTCVESLIRFEMDGEDFEDTQCA